MDVSKSILTQKQVRNNAEDLQKEYLDLAAWEEQMKKKDLAIRNMTDDRVLPPIRCRKKPVPSEEDQQNKETNSDSNHEKSKKAKRIASGDYASWDKFDVEKACDEVEEKDKSNVITEKMYEIPTPEELERDHNEATKLKEQGNALVLQKQYAKAIGKYNEAIAKFSGDATYYANRALCQIKLTNFYSAVSDCTEAIKLDSRYVKAYHRRALSRIELRHFEDAKKDVQMILELDPSNKDAVAMRDTIDKRIKKESMDAVKVLKEREKKTSSLEREIGNKFGQKLFGSKSSEKKSEEAVEKKKGHIAFEHKTAPKDNRLGVVSVQQKEPSNEEFPPWLPPIRDDVSIIQPLVKPPVQKKQTMQRIPVTALTENESIFKDVEKNSVPRVNNIEEDLAVKKTDNTKASSIIEEIKDVNKSQIKEVKNFNMEKTKITSNVENMERTKVTLNVENMEKPPEVNVTLESTLVVPKTAISFLIAWRKNTSIDFRYEYLKLIIPKNLPEIFKDSMESNIFSDIIIVLNTKFVPNNDKVYEFLFYLSKIKRFRALVLFMTQSEKEALQNLFEICKTKEGKSDEEVQNLYTAYEL
ncbi:RNA polymerase II-associated protein 3 [Trichogramma pretiosum]|uniref:RNA polymerase II-associated protein 3 n=1 Tax=Trichogramma pretiosum TaxID=7493 RepID=UPI0006C98B69|nr:RNA polymerase II-associated protein 3 [Trichogramma pretiosum]XP_023316779.1 RNA polymerase II-associated protein 3 [Trichogramma pretiosum]